MPLPYLLLDSGPLGKLAHPRPRPDIAAWASQIQGSYTLVIPEVNDFEVRRELLAANLPESLKKLDGFKLSMTYAPITTQVMLHAAHLWADARRAGRPTADRKELDCDVILAAHALELGGTVATENVGHLSRYVTARHWSEITP